MSIDFDSHRVAAEEEDVAYLVAAGLTFEQACKRLGINPKTLERRVLRRVGRAS